MFEVPGKAFKVSISGIGALGSGLGFQRYGFRVRVSVLYS